MMTMRLGNYVVTNQTFSKKGNPIPLPSSNYRHQLMHREPMQLIDSLMAFSV